MSDNGFIFSIGDILVCRASTGLIIKTRVVVVERVTVESHSAVTRYYMCRVVSENGMHSVTTPFSEVELRAETDTERQDREEN